MKRTTNPLLLALRTHCAHLLPSCGRAYTTQYKGNNRHRVKFFKSSKLAVPTASAIREKLEEHGWKEVTIKEMRNPHQHYIITHSLQIFATKEE